MAKKLQKKKKKKLSASEIRTRAHIKTVRKVFINTGFDRAIELAEKEIQFGGQTGEFDDAFVVENLILLMEYTSSQPSDVTGHLKNKKIIFSKITADPKGFISYLIDKFPAFSTRLGSKFHLDNYILRIVYCSMNYFDENIKTIVNEPVYLDFPILKYLEKVTDTVKISAFNEIADFLMVPREKIATNGVIAKKATSALFNGMILPEASSGFPSGYKVVSFYADAATLLASSFVLRREGWRGSSSAYQRMLSASKIENIRKKLKADGHVFVNNVIATLPSHVHPERDDGTTVDISTLTETEPVCIRLPMQANSIGIIDGQHRLYSYYETKKDDVKISTLRHQQNLLVTGIIFPNALSKTDIDRFSAQLFLTINSNQTNAKTPLRQEIEVVLKPYGTVAIARQIMARLAKVGPLAGQVESYFFDKGKLKTSSIVSYGLAPLVKLSGDDSLFHLFGTPYKQLVVDGNSDSILEEYIEFATKTINVFLSGIRFNVPKDIWTSDPSVQSRILTVTCVNGFLITLRMLIDKKIDIDFEKIKIAFKGINISALKSYKSSQYSRMAEKIFSDHF